MKTKHIPQRLFFIALFGLSCSFLSAKIKVVRVEGHMIPVNSTWDQPENPAIKSQILSYKSRIDSIMNIPIGKAACTMEANKPESPLSDLTADILREEASKILGHPADLGVINIGGLRTTLSEGTITVRNIYEIFPFENVLVVLKLKGTDVQKLFEQMAHFGGEGISGAQLKISKKGELVKATVQGQPVDPNKEYTVGTIDFVAGGNDGMLAFRNNYDLKEVPDGLLRDVFMNYVKKLNSQGKEVSKTCDGRIKIVEQ